MLTNMFSTLRQKWNKAKGVGNDDYQQPTTLHDDEYLFTLHLHKVNNPLNAKPLWVSEYTNDRDIEAKTGNKADRLWDALNRYRTIAARQDEDFGQLVEDPRIFSDVVVWIPERYWKRAIKSRGVQLSIMIDQLQKMHRDDFNGKLWNNRLPHYCVMPQKGLADDEVVFQFGLSVFIPSEDDQQLADLTITYQNNGYPFQSWVFWENNRKIKRPVGLYQGQHYLQIAPMLAMRGLAAPHWFEHNEGYFQINLEGIEGDTDLHQLFADGEFVREGKVDDLFSALSYHFLNANDDSDRLELKVLPKAALNPQINHNDPTVSASTQMKHLTMMFQPHAVTSNVYQLLIKGIALPRFDTGLVPTMDRWQLAFDCQGNMYDSSDSYQHKSLTLNSYRKKKGLWLQRENTDEAELLTIPQDIDCDEYIYRLKKSPLSDHHALLELPMQLPYTIGEEPMIIGRDVDKKLRNKIVLNMLDKPETLFMNDGTACSTSINYLGFSGKHIAIERKGERLFVKQRSHSAPFYTLDKDYRITKRFDPNSKDVGEVALGEYLLVGYYLLQFHQQS